VAVSLAGAVLPYTRLGVVLGFIPLPLSLLAAILLLALTYLVLVQTVKTWFYRRHALL
jgi:P-type Mg2+ transporter